MSNQPPLNPDALEAGAQSMECQCSKHVIDCGEYYADCPRHVHYPKAVSAYLAVALPEAGALAWDEGFQAGWEEHEDPGAFVNDFWDAKTPNPYLPEGN